MTKVRQDAWSHEDDVLLAETVLNHIKRGSTQLKAFEEVGDQLNRTAAACGFRWNAVVRDRYENHISDAKRERKSFQRNDAVTAVEQTMGRRAEPRTSMPSRKQAAHLEMVDVISFLKQYEQSGGVESQKLASERDQLKQENQQLKEKLSHIEKEHESLLTIINRARNMMFMDEAVPDSFMSSSFRMDENGNLQQVSKAD